MTTCNKYQGRFGIDKDYYSFQWTIDKFDHIAKSHILINAQSLWVQRITQSWVLHLKAEEDNWIGIYCGPYYSEHKPVASMEIMIPTPDTSEQFFFKQETEMKHLSGPNDSEGRLLFVKKFINLREPIENLPLVDGSLIIIVSMVEYLRQKPRTLDMKKYETNSVHRLMLDMERLFKSGAESSDFKIITGDKEFMVHKQVLAARSSFFATLLGSGFKGKQEGVFEVLDLSSKIVGIALEFMYTGKLKLVLGPRAQAEWVELAFAAEKFALVDLRQMLWEEAMNKNRFKQGHYTM